jgi:hypothetical protein
VLDYGLQEEQHEHRQGKREGKQRGEGKKMITESKARQKEAKHHTLRTLNQKGKSDKRITESKARQKESTTLCTNLAD